MNPKSYMTSSDHAGPIFNILKPISPYNLCSFYSKDLTGWYKGMEISQGDFRLKASVLIY